MAHTTGSDGDGPRGRRALRGTRRLGTPKPEWGDNVIEADFGGRTRRPPVAPAAEPLSSDGDWISRQILGPVEAGADTARRSRGRNYHRSGRIRTLQLGKGTVNSLVTGSQLEPFEVSLRWSPLSGNQADFIRGECLEHPENLRRLLAGRAPRRDVASVLSGSGRLMDSGCTCPDRAVVCKHRVAVAYALAERLAADPVEFLDWRGVDVRGLLESAGAVAGDPASPELHGEEGKSGERYSPTEFWGDPGTFPSWGHLDIDQGLGLGDPGIRNAVIRRVSWNAVDQLHVLDELQNCYDLLTGGSEFEQEPWLSGPSGTMDRHD